MRNLDVFYPRFSYYPDLASPQAPQINAENASWHPRPQITFTFWKICIFWPRFASPSSSFEIVKDEECNVSISRNLTYGPARHVTIADMIPHHLGYRFIFLAGGLILFVFFISTSRLGSSGLKRASIVVGLHRNDKGFSKDILNSTLGVSRSLLPQFSWRARAGRNSHLTVSKALRN